MLPTLMRNWNLQRRARAVLNAHIARYNIWTSGHTLLFANARVGYLSRSAGLLAVRPFLFLPRFIAPSSSPSPSTLAELAPAQLGPPCTANSYMQAVRFPAPGVLTLSPYIYI